MSKSDSGSSIAGGSFIAAIAGAAIALLANKTVPLEGLRPPVQEQTLGSYAYRDVDARLWQDPFDAFARLDPKLAPPCAAASEATEQKAKGKKTTKPVLLEPRECHTEHFRRELEPSKPTQILPVLISGAPYAENVETRRRTRYAVVAALAGLRYKPVDALHIDFYAVPRSPAFRETNEYKNWIVPYEVFEREQDTPQRVVVLWINEAYLTDTIGKDKNTAAQIFTDLLQPAKRQASQNGEMRILGPSTSDSLDAIEDIVRSQRGLLFLQYGATKQRETIGTDPQHSRIVRTITEDKNLAVVLRDEMDRRNININGGDGLAIISEIDTEYGRHIDELFVPLEMRTLPDRCIDGRACLAVRRYLRGIDGASPVRPKPSEKTGNGAAKDASAKDGTPKPDTANDPTTLDKAFGAAQNDYLRRLAHDLKSVDTQWRKQGKSGLKAIGVLGSDVFDKLLVLRALRPMFPTAVFFTTDYDAALAAPSELKWTRNLIVASSFGPVLKPELQLSAPPFRSAYQTAAFYSVQKAITKEEIDESLLCGGQLFEITRAGRFKELDFQNRACGKSGIRPDIEPLHFSIFSKEKNFFAALFGLLGLTSLILSTRLNKANPPERASKAPQQRVWLVDRESHVDANVVAIVFLLLAMMFLFWENVGLWLTGDGYGEPVALSEGVSVWPTIAIRLFLILLAWRVIAHTEQSLYANLRDIHCKMNQFLAKNAKANSILSDKLQNPEDVKLFKSGEIEFSNCAFEKLFDVFTPQKPTFVQKRSDGAYDVYKGWSAYLAAELPAARRRRCIIITVCFTALFLVMWYVHGDLSPPIRGCRAQIAFFVSLVIEFMAITYAVLYVIDATALCLCFVNDLEHHNTRWVAPRDGTEGARNKIENDAYDLEFIERRTSCILPLIYWPFFLVAMTIVERSKIFADYPMSGIIVFFVGLGLALMFGCAWALNDAVEFARSTTLSEIDKKLLHDTKKAPDVPAVGGKTSPDPDSNGKMTKEHLETLREYIKNLDGGSFSPIWRQPLFKGMILPIAGIASKTLFETNWFVGLT